jgi:hypothetical protein
MSAQQRFEASRELIDEEMIAALLENLPALLTESEQAQLRECARLAVEQQCRVAEIGVDAARRHSTTDIEECNRREAVGRYFTMMLIHYAETAASENMTEN